MFKDDSTQQNTSIIHPKRCSPNLKNIKTYSLALLIQADFEE